MYRCQKPAIETIGVVCNRTQKEADSEGRQSHSSNDLSDDSGLGLDSDVRLNRVHGTNEDDNGWHVRIVIVHCEVHHCGKLASH